jgi:hypothetical protein
MDRATAFAYLVFAAGQIHVDGPQLLAGEGEKLKLSQTVVLAIRGTRPDVENAKDTIAILTPSATDEVAVFAANLESDFAQLRPGVWPFKIGFVGGTRPQDRRYPGFVQADRVTLDVKDGEPREVAEGVCIHSGISILAPGSIVIPSGPWPKFRAIVNDQLRRRASTQKGFWLVLVEQSDFDAWQKGAATAPQGNSGPEQNPAPALDATTSGQPQTEQDEQAQAPGAEEGAA